jgi:hypothetical protein
VPRTCSQDSRVNIYIIYIPNLRSSASVLGSDLKQDRFNYARDRATEKQKGAAREQEKAAKEHECVCSDFSIITV